MEVIIDGIIYKPVIDNITVYWMYDGQVFGNIEDTSSIDCILEQADEFWTKDQYGCLCPIGLNQGETEIRRVGGMAHGHPNPEYWNEQKQKWRESVESDPDVMAVINSTPSAKREEA